MARLRPSSAARRVACAGSYQMELKYPREQSPEAREGDAAHWLATELLRGTIDVNSVTQTPEGELITDDMRKGAKLLHDDVFKVYVDDVLHIEERIDISVIHPDCYGTPDVWGYDSFSKTLLIWDYKYGHKHVDVFENWQLLEYAAGILSYLKDGDISPKHVTFTIVQPRDYSNAGGQVRSWSIFANDLEPYFETLRRAEHAATSPDPKCTPSPECHYCNARAHCPALQNAALTAMDVSLSAIPQELTAEPLGYELTLLQRAAQFLKARISGLEVEAFARLGKGENVPGFKLGYSKPREKWAKSTKETLDTLAPFGIDISETVLVTPKQAIDAGLPSEVVRSLSITPSGEKKLEPFTAKDARKMFGGSK